MNRWFTASYIALFGTMGLAMGTAEMKHTIMDPAGQIVAALESVAILFAVIGYFEPTLCTFKHRWRQDGYSSNLEVRTCLRCYRSQARHFYEDYLTRDHWWRWEEL